MAAAPQTVAASGRLSGRRERDAFLNCGHPSVSPRRFYPWPLRLSGKRAARPWRKSNRAPPAGVKLPTRHRGPRDDVATLGLPVLLPHRRAQRRHFFAGPARIPASRASETLLASLDQGISFHPRGSQSAQLKRRSTPASTSAREGHIGSRRSHPNRENRRCLQPGIFRLNGSGVP
jgi:hypothetical protein